MITSAIGKIFLEAYNEKYGTDYDARTFFIEKFHPLFFTENKENMFKAGNTPLGNPSYKNKSKEERLNILLENVSNNKIDSSTCIDFPSFDATRKNSGQVSSLYFPMTQEDVFYSWIGNGFKVGTKSNLTGGDELSILFFDKKILLDIFKGWSRYRLKLDNTQGMQGNQIHIWNAHWIYNMYTSKNFDINYPPKDIGILISQKGKIRLDTLGWLDVVFCIAKLKLRSNILGYVYGMNDRNNNFTTIGFRTFNLSQIIRPFDLYQKYFGFSNGLNVKKLWDTEYGFKTICNAGVIGIKATEPKGLRDYIFKSKSKSPKRPKNEDEIININVYKIWLLAMLNNDELWDKSQELAEMLDAASTDKDKPESTKPENLVKNVLAANNKKQFVAAASEVATFVADRDKFKEIVKEVHCMPTDNVPYFLTLLRFQFNTLQKTTAK